MEFVNVGHAFVLHGCSSGMFKVLMEAVVLSIFFADPDGLKTGLDAEYMFPGRGSRQLPDYTSCTPHSSGNAFSLAFGGLGDLGQGPERENTHVMPVFHALPACTKPLLRRLHT